MVGMSSGFGTETEKLRFSDNFAGFSLYCWSVRVQVALGGDEVRVRRSQKLRGA